MHNKDRVFAKSLSDAKSKLSESEFNNLLTKIRKSNQDNGYDCRTISVELINDTFDLLLSSSDVAGEDWTGRHYYNFASFIGKEYHHEFRLLKRIKSKRSLPSNLKHLVDLISTIDLDRHIELELEKPSNSDLHNVYTLRITSFNNNDTVTIREFLGIKK